MQVAHRFMPEQITSERLTAERAVPIVLTVLVHVGLVYFLAIGMGFVPKPSFVPPDITVVPVPKKEPPPMAQDDRPTLENAFTTIEPPAPQEPTPFEIETPRVPPPPGDIGGGETGPRTAPEPLFAPHLARSFEPPYPDRSRLLGEEGIVQVRVTISPTGEVGDVRVEKSSGYPRLDEAALKAVRQWRFAPARRGAQAIVGSTVVAVRFRLR